MIETIQEHIVPDGLATTELKPRYRDEAQVKTMTGCAYCTPDHTTTKPLDSWRIDEQSGYAGVNRSDNTLWYHVADGQNLVASRFKINFCPKCGKALNKMEE